MEFAFAIGIGLLTGSPQHVIGLRPDPDGDFVFNGERVNCFVDEVITTERESS